MLKTIYIYKNLIVTDNYRMKKNIIIKLILVSFFALTVSGPQASAATSTENQKKAAPSSVTPKTSKGVGKMELNDALAMVKAWIAESRASERDITGSMKVDLRGRFLVRVKAAIFRFDPEQHQLLVSGLVGYDVKTLSKYPDEWQFLVRTGKREHTTMMYGEAEFELLREPLFDLKPDVVLLTKAYTESLTDGVKLGVQIRWLLSDADYWFVNRYNEVMGKSEADLIKEAPTLNEWMLKNRPKPW